MQLEVSVERKEMKKMKDLDLEIAVNKIVNNIWSFDADIFSSIVYDLHLDYLFLVSGLTLENPFCHNQSISFLIFGASR